MPGHRKEDRCISRTHGEHAAVQWPQRCRTGQGQARTGPLRAEFEAGDIDSEGRERTLHAGELRHVSPGWLPEKRPGGTPRPERTPGCDPQAINRGQIEINRASYARQDQVATDQPFCRQKDGSLHLDG